MTPKKPIAAKSKKPVVVAVSGYFNPLHVGHLDMIEKARKLGDKLVVIVLLTLGFAIALAVDPKKSVIVLTWVTVGMLIGFIGFEIYKFFKGKR
jgi:cytidyltransferase-like protein